MIPADLPACLDDYELFEELGTEGPATIYRARQKSLDRPVALHIVQLADLGDASEGERYLRGARAAARLDHPLIVRVFDVGSGDGLAFVATGLVEGQTLAERCQGKALPPQAAAELVQRLAAAVASAHQRSVIHGGLDPQAVRLTAAGQARLTGFGTFRGFVSGATLASIATAVAPCTPPEYVAGSPTQNPRVDVYGLGTLLYFALTGQPPFRGESAPQLVMAIAEEAPAPPSKRQSRVPRELDAICLKCLAKRPDERYADAAEVAKALQHWLKPETARPNPSDPLVDTIAQGPASTRKLSAVVVAAKRRPIMLAASGVAILGLLVIAGWFWWRPSVGDISASSPTTSSASTLAAKPVRPAPPPASAPFDADAALAHQRAWAQWLGSVVETTNSIDMKLRLIPPGEFDMGATDEEVAERRRTFSQTSANRDTGFVKSANDAVNSEMPRRRIRITQPFWIGSYETTIGDFQRFCDETGYVAYSERMAVDVWGLNADGRYTVGPQYSWRKTGLPDNPRNAVGSLTWYDIEAFCHWLTGREGVVYRVPTEAEWEYACRAGTTHLTFFTADQLPKHANVPDQSLHRVISLEGGLAWHSWDDGFPSVSPVGSFLPNPFGLYDVIGNQWEVCLDWYSFDAYQKGTVEDPSGPSTGTRKVIRGGSHDPYTVPEAMTATCRIGVAVDNPQLTAGFRVIREIDPPAHAPLDPAWTAKLLARVRQAVDDAAALPLVGDFQMARAVDRWKAADVHLRRAERYSASTEGRAALAELAKTVAFGSRLAGGVREIDRKLVESLPETGWDLHYAGAAEGLAKLFGELGWDPTKIGAIEARTKLNALPPALRESVKHWLIRWELYAAVSKRPEVAALRGWALMLDDDAWKQRFLAARTAADPAMLLKFSAEPTGSRAQSAGDHVLMVESLAVAGLLGKPEAQKAVSGATVDVSKNADLFWAFLRKAQAEEMSTVTSEDPRTRNDKVWEAYRIATRLSPEKTVLRRRFDQSFKSSPAAAERELAEWVLQKGGTVQVWRPFPATDSWARFPIRSLSLLPSDLFHVTGLALTNCPITDADLLRLHNLPFLDTLFLDGTPITDDGVRKLSQSAEPLQTLSLERTQISDEGLVQTPVANELLLRNTNVTAAGVLKWQNERPSSFVIHESLFTDSNSLDQRAVRSESNRALVFDANCRVDAPIAIPSGASLTLEALIVPRARLGFNLAALIEVRVGGAPWKLDRNELYGAFLHYLNSRQVRLGALSNQGRSESAVGKPLVNTRLYNRLMHVAAVFEPDVFRLYVDGRIAAETKVAPFTRGTTGTLNIGRQPTDRLPELGQFMGLIDEVRISSIARYKEDFVPAERHEPDQHTLALYHFDEGEGDVAKDSSGHGRDGKITGAKWVKSLTYSPSLPTIPSSSADSSPTANVGSWVQLFDGKSLAGWKTPPKQPGDWSVQDGLLTGKGPLSLLFTERGDFEDFHGRAEVRINAGEKAASSLARKVF